MKTAPAGKCRTCGLGMVVFAPTREMAEELAAASPDPECWKCHMAGIDVKVEREMRELLGERGVAIARRTARKEGA
jgi:hypothetical protein